MVRYREVFFRLFEHAVLHYLHEWICLPIVDPNNWKPATRTEQGKWCLNVFFIFDNISPF
ncbi:hypothetical protein ANCDUO_25777 [Ancylostoma duodenale]|uniref:Uncharacterized protein n=1 Tax=Ancylostoma duodenale TaxID=51022 RepID=A0A0C2FBQ9_9BILA|nr:hypothetical protein ANCDUO_25777 [Ancylostoma duodenale]